MDRRTPRLMAAGAIGNLLEWYDFAVYGYFAAAIGRAFFPEQDKVAQVLAAFGVFAVGFMMRPIGGAIFGHVGDRIGRPAALTLSVAAMAVPTFLIGVLPGYDVLGLAAPVLLTVLRMVQGLSVGGEYTTSIIFLVEHARPERRGVVGALGTALADREGEPDVPEPFRSQLVRTGFIKVDTKGWFRKDRYVPAELIAAVEGDAVRLSVTRDQLPTDEG
jgi:hypothetical protein